MLQRWQLRAAPRHLARIELGQHHADRQRLVAVLGDLSGPKIRTGTFAAGKVNLREGQEFTLTTRNVPGDATAVSCTYPLAVLLPAKAEAPLPTWPGISF